jgi:exonuclease III
MLFQELKCDKEKIPVEATPAGYKSFWLSGDQGKGGLHWESDH